MRALITGVSGFAGSHLAEHLLGSGFEVTGSIRWRSQMQNIEHLEGRLRLVECDIRDATSVKRLVEEAAPDQIYHLAAQSFVPTSWHAPAETLVTNIVGQLNVLEAMRELKVDRVLQIAGSSEEYGLVSPEDVPIRETTELRPMSPYGVSKVGQDMLGFQYSQSYGLKVVRTRAFNHTGPRRGGVFVTSNFCKQVARIEKGLQDPVVEVGNLDAVRDFSDVRDIVRGYALSLERGKPGEVYNICSGRGVKIRDLLDMIVGMAKVDVKVQKDPNRMRPSDVPVLIGDNSKFCSQTGWAPEFTLEHTVEDLLNYWRERTAHSGLSLRAAS
jgi:GDP-4-dehydro-6-deoxy-D-mannose reductase